VRIIGGHDYYDSAAALGRDPAIIFKRQEYEVTAKDFPVHKDNLVRYAWQPVIRFDQIKTDWRANRGQPWVFTERGKTWRVGFHTVLFCGKVYGVGYGVEVNTAYPAPRVWFHSIEALDAWLLPRGMRLNDISKSWSLKGTHRDRVAKHFEVRGATNMDRLIKERIVVAHVEHVEEKEPAKWKVNGASLHTLDFARVVPPYEAWQELSMWVGSTLGPEGPEMVQITDDDIKAAKHGFDRWSFRKKVR
jgi:hypothetical protein